MSGKGIMSNLSGSIDGYLDAVTDGRSSIDSDVVEVIELPPLDIEKELKEISEFNLVLKDKYKDYQRKELYDAIIDVESAIRKLEEVSRPIDNSLDGDKI